MERDYKKLRWMCNVQHPKIELMVETVNLTNNMRALDVITDEIINEFDLAEAVFQLGNVNVVKYYYEKHVKYHLHKFRACIDHYLRTLCDRNVVFLKKILTNEELGNFLSCIYSYTHEFTICAEIYHKNLHPSAVLYIKMLGLDISKIPLRSYHRVCKMGIINISEAEKEYHEAAIIIQRWYKKVCRS